MNGDNTIAEFKAVFTKTLLVHQSPIFVRCTAVFEKEKAKTHTVKFTQQINKPHFKIGKQLIPSGFENNALDNNFLLLFLKINLFSINVL